MSYLACGDIQLYYECHGEGEPLLLLHGLGSSARDWLFQVDYFRSRYQVIAADMRGHGRTDKPAGPYSVAMLAGDTAALLRALAVGPAHVLGLSMGGMIAFQLALDAPALVRSLVIVNSGPALVPRNVAQRLAVWRRLAISRFLGMRRMGQFLAGRLFPEPHQTSLHDAFVARWAENDRPAYLASMRALIGWSVLERLPTLELPVLVVSGDMDYTPVADKVAYTRLIPRAELQVIANSRHVTPVDQPETFNRLVAEFLARQGGGEEQAKIEE